VGKKKKTEQLLVTEVKKKPEELSMKESVELFSKIVASNQDLFEIDLNTKIWTSGPQRFAQIPIKPFQQFLW